MDEELMLEKELDELREQHRLLDEKINTLADNAYQDQLQVMRLKREKLAVRDAMIRIEEQIYPDIIA